jgi:polyisoprenoid-binding protein YceI
MTTPSGSQAADPLTRAGSWQLDPAGSSVTFQHKTMWGLATVRGTFETVHGSGEIHPDGTASGRLEIDAASLGTKNGTRDTHLRSADFFHADAHPQIVAEIGPVTRQDGATAAVAGTLTVRGTSKPIQLTARVTQATDDAITIEADGEFSRADFGMTWNRLGMVTGNATVSVTARFVPATAKQPA